VIQADEGSSLISGFNQKVDKELYLKKFNAGELTEILNKETVKADDVFFLPAGRVHTIGKGLLIAEIQQTSDITYRIYDFDRVDDKGNKRELHTEEALDAIDYNFYEDYKTPYKAVVNQPVALVSCPYFTTNVLNFTKETARDYSNLDSFVIHVCLEGSYILKYGVEEIPMNIGDCILIPATTDKVVLNTNKSFKILESYIP
jgi:mannose-6-phosphate isomerase